MEYFLLRCETETKQNGMERGRGKLIEIEKERFAYIIPCGKWFYGGTDKILGLNICFVVGPFFLFYDSSISLIRYCLNALAAL